jgi:hypothetical protein
MLRDLIVERAKDLGFTKLSGDIITHIENELNAGLDAPLEKTVQRSVTVDAISRAAKLVKAASDKPRGGASGKAASVSEEDSDEA